jgi:predicted Zn finger-like uncharacterized protein
MSLVIRCPSCPRQLRVPDDLLGQQVKCPSCGAVFTASEDMGADDTPPPQGEVAAPEPSLPDDDTEEVTERPRGVLPRRSRVRPRYERRAEEDEEDDGDDDDRPRSGGYRRSRAAARSRVSGPATALTVTGGLALALSLVSLCLQFVITANGRGPADARAERLLGGVIGAVLGIAWGLFVVLGARKMKNLESYGMAMAGTIVAMLPCNGCCLLGLPFGIWALVVLSDAEVKAAFR